MSKLAQLKIPGPGDTQTEIKVPTGVPDPLKGDSAASQRGIIQTSYNLLFAAVIFAAVLFALISGIQYIMASGDPEKVASARKRLIYAILGLVISALAFVIVSVVITALGGNRGAFSLPGVKP